MKLTKVEIFQQIGVPVGSLDVAIRNKRLKQRNPFTGKQEIEVADVLDALISGALLPRIVNREKILKKLAVCLGERGYSEDEKGKMAEVIERYSDVKVDCPQLPDNLTTLHALARMSGIDYGTLRGYKANGHFGAVELEGCYQSEGVIIRSRTHVIKMIDFFAVIKTKVNNSKRKNRIKKIVKACNEQAKSGRYASEWRELALLFKGRIKWLEAKDKWKNTVEVIGE